MVVDIQGSESFIKKWCLCYEGRKVLGLMNPCNYILLGAYCSDHVVCVTYTVMHTYMLRAVGSIKHGRSGWCPLSM